jgi:flagellar biosynthesis protein FlhF
MKIKRYTAPSMREALARVRAEQGADAVILSSRRGEEGIEVIAAVDYDEALFADANRQRSAVSPTMAPAPASPEPAIAVSRAQPKAVQEQASQRSARSPKLIPAHFQRLTMSSLSVAAVLRDSLPAGASAVRSEPVRTPAAAKPARPTQSLWPAQPTQQSRPAQPPQQSRLAQPPPRSQLEQAPTSPPPVRVDANYTAMQRELKDMRQMLESGFAGITWNDKRLREPLKARVLEELSAAGIAPDVASLLAKLTPQRTTLENPSHIPMALLVKHLPVVDDLSTVSGGIMAVVGPTGAGKTTTIAKLAARWCMRHGSKDLALVSTDSYRIGARDQLMTYARVLGAAMHAANSGKELAALLERLKSKKLILIDTAGMGTRDARLAGQLAVLKQGAPRARILLALPAQSEGHALEEIVQAFAPLNPVACILTKVDEAASLGAVISTTMRHRLKIAYVCDGQRVPEDMHAAKQKRVSLISAALSLKDGRPIVRDEAYLARNFGRGSAHV